MKQLQICTKHLGKCLFITVMLASSYSDALPLEAFQHWQQKDFVGTNQYYFKTENSAPLVKVESKQSASGLFLKNSVNLNKTPILNWSWKIDHALDTANERKKSGDDFAARVYVLASTGPLPWQTKALSYVWSSYQKIGLQWKNPYTGKVMMISVDSGEELAGSWQHHQRNVQQDLELAFGKIFNKIDVIAVMTDTDDSNQQVTAWYKNIFFSEK